MSPSIGKYLFSCICLFVVCFSEAQQPTADSLRAAGNYRLASLSYAGLVFSANSLQQTIPLRYRWAHCQYKIGNYKEALNILQRVNIYDTDQTALVDSIQYLKARSYYFSGQPAQSIRSIVEYQIYTEGQPLPPHYVLLTIMNHHAMAEYQKAHDALNAYAKANNMAVNGDSLYKKALKQRFKNPKKADMLSTFVPGLGQMYAGKPAHGLLSFTLTVASIGFMGYHFYTGHYFTGFFTGSGLFNKFYWGGKKHSEYLANYYNQQKVNDYQKQLNTFLINHVFNDK